MFTYCSNNPIIHTDPRGTSSRVVGAGIQFEMNIGGAVVGVEIIGFWDIDECANGGFTIACYIYGGMSVNSSNPFISAALGIITDNASLLSSGAAGLAAIIGLLQSELSLSVSGVLISGNEQFTSTESYEGSFTSIGGSWGNLTGSVAYADNCIAYSLGGVVAGTTSIIPNIGTVSKTHYSQIFEINIGSRNGYIGRNYTKGRGLLWAPQVQRM